MLRVLRRSTATTVHHRELLIPHYEFKGMFSIDLSHNGSWIYSVLNSLVGNKKEIELFVSNFFFNGRNSASIYVLSLSNALLVLSFFLINSRLQFLNEY